MLCHDDLSAATKLVSVGVQSNSSPSCAVAPDSKIGNDTNDLRSSVLDPTNEPGLFDKPVVMHHPLLLRV